MILVITSKRDGHIEAVTKHIDSAGVAWCRINTEDFATNIELDISPGDGSGVIFIKDSGKEITVNEIAAVWYRKPDPIDVSHFQMDIDARSYAEAEFNEIVLGLYALLDNAFWINNPFWTRTAHRKLLQLKTAIDVGFTVPPSLVTNLPERALDFASQIEGDIAIKSLGALSVSSQHGDKFRQFGMFTRRVHFSELVEFKDKIEFMPTLFQQFIPKRSELRVTCVGDRIFTCEIRARPGDLTSDDHRFDIQSLRHEAVEYPALREKIWAYMSAFRLNFGCFDFIVPQQGEPVFLEMNPNGQWLWVEQQTGQEIARAIATELVSRVKGQRNQRARA